MVRTHPSYFDPECEDLILSLNEIPGIETTCSCCGHGEQPFRIWFVADSLAALPNVAYWFDSRHCGCPGWRVVAQTDCLKGPVSFMIEGPVGKQAYEDAQKIAELILKDLDSMDQVYQAHLGQERKRFEDVQRHCQCIGKNSV